MFINEIDSGLNTGSDFSYFLSVISHQDDIQYIHVQFETVPLGALSSKHVEQLADVLEHGQIKYVFSEKNSKANRKGIVRAMSLVVCCNCPVPKIIHSCSQLYAYMHLCIGCSLVHIF